MAFSDPEKIIQSAGIFEGMMVADFGCGMGYYTFPLARKVGDGGRVYAIDIQRSLVETVKRTARMNGFRTVDGIVGDVDEPGGSKLRDGAVDVVVMANLLFQVEHKDALIAEAQRILKPKGRVLLIEWADSFGGIGPHPKDVVPRERAEQLFRGGGFTIQREIPNAGDHHYGILFVRTP